MMSLAALPDPDDQQPEVLDVGQLADAELEREAVRGHELVLEAGELFVRRAQLEGALLLEMRERLEGGFQAWVDEKMPFSYWAAADYMRIAAAPTELLEGATSVNHGLKLLRAAGFNRTDAGGASQVSEEVRDEARRLYGSGTPRNEIALRLGVGFRTVAMAVDPEFARRERQRMAGQKRRRRAALRALERQEREQEIKRAVKDADKDMQEAYAMAERFQDVIARAHRGSDDQQRRRHLALATEHYHKMRDEIVLALGVS